MSAVQDRPAEGESKKDSKAILDEFRIDGQMTNPVQNANYWDQEQEKYQEKVLFEITKPLVTDSQYLNSHPAN